MYAGRACSGSARSGLRVTAELDPLRAASDCAAMRTTLVIVLSLAALAACGLQGDLERPLPLWGDPPNEGPNDPRTIKAQEEAEAAERAAREARERAEAEARQAAQPASPPASSPQSR